MDIDLDRYLYDRRSQEKVDDNINDQRSFEEIQNDINNKYYSTDRAQRAKGTVDILTKKNYIDNNKMTKSKSDSKLNTFQKSNEKNQTATTINSNLRPNTTQNTSKNSTMGLQKQVDKNVI